MAVVRDGHRTVIGAAPAEIVTANGAAALDLLDHLTPGWWAGFLAYDLGRAIERVAPRPQVSETEGGMATGSLHTWAPIPDLMLARFNARLVVDPVTERAWIEGEGAGRSHLEHALRLATEMEPLMPLMPATPPGLGPWSSSFTLAQFEDAVRAVINLLEAGDCYQVNLTRQLICEQSADPVELFAALVEQNPAPHEALLRFGDIAIVSASPERFLRRDGNRIETRPMKGTGTDPAMLSASVKDRAENVMIVDLARNDLGRVCEFGSIEVPDLCVVEAHPGLYQMVSTVRGVLRPDISLGGLIRSTFPPASVTGAPKPRVLQAIEDLELVPRGVYCGAIGWIDTQRNTADLNVAIRTFAIAGGITSLGVGSGIVADSDPTAEWEETELKAARLLVAAGAGVKVGTDARVGATQ